MSDPPRSLANPTKRTPLHVRERPACKLPIGGPEDRVGHHQAYRNRLYHCPCTCFLINDHTTSQIPSEVCFHSNMPPGIGWWGRTGRGQTPFPGSRITQGIPTSHPSQIRLCCVQKFNHVIWTQFILLSSWLRLILRLPGDGKMVEAFLHNLLRQKFSMVSENHIFLRALTSPQVSLIAIFT